MMNVALKCCFCVELRRFEAGPEPHNQSERTMALLDPAGRTVLEHAVSIRGSCTWFAA